MVNKEEITKIQEENNKMVREFLKKGSDDLNAVIGGLRWLSENIDWRDAEMNKTDGLSNKYAIRQNRIMSRIKAFVETQDDGFIILLRILIELPLLQDILDIAVLTATIRDGIPKSIEKFSRYEQLLICKLVFGEGSHWN